MKKKQILVLFMLLVMMLSLVACSSVDDQRNDLLADGKRVMSCDETIYYHVKNPASGFLRYCGSVAIGYRERSAFLGMQGTGNAYFSLNEDNGTLVFLNSSKSLLECWGEYVGVVYCDDEDSELLSDLSEEKYSSYKLLSHDRSGYYTLGETLPYDLQNPSEDAFRTWTLTSSQSELKYKEGYTILGCDASGNFGVEIAKLVWDESRNVYFYYVYKPDNPYAVLKGRALRKDSMALVENFLKQAELVTPTVEVREGSLEDALAQQRIIYTIGFSLVALFLAVTIAFAFRRQLKELFDFCVYRRKVNQLDKTLDPGSDEELKPLDIKLTREEMAHVLAADEEDSVAEGNRHFCPVCGARCDWTALKCAACGAELVFHGKKLVRVDSLHTPGKGGHGSYIMDVNAVSYTEFLRHHAPKRLNRAANLLTVWYVLLASLTLFSTVLIYGSLLFFTQSALISLFAFVPGAALLALAILYHNRRNLVPPVVFAVCSGLSVAYSLYLLFSGALTTGTTLNAVVSVIACLAEIACHVIFSTLGIVRTREMRDEYKDFKLRRGNYKQ